MRNILMVLIGYLGLCGIALAQSPAYPTKPVRLLVGTPPGGGTDVTARIIAEKLRELLGQPFIVENKPGANGNVASDFVAASPPDGYTLFAAVVGTTTVNPSMYTDKVRDPNKDFAPISQFTSIPLILVINSKIPANNLKEFIAYAKSSPDKLNFGSSGYGASGHLASEILGLRTGLQFVHVPYTGNANAVRDLMGGRLAFVFTGLIPKGADQLRVLGVSTESRSSFYPDVPSLSEVGLPGFSVAIWTGVVAPAGTPRSVVTRLNGAMVKAAASPDTLERLKKAELEPKTNTPEEFGAFLKAETEKYAKIVKTLGIKPE